MHCSANLMKKQPYVAITGLVSAGEVDFASKQFHNLYSAVSSHNPAVGFLVSEKTLKDKTADNLRFPDLKTVQSLLARTPAGIYRVIHYKTTNNKTVARQVAELFGGNCSADLCDIIQLNMPSEQTNEIAIIKASFNFEIALKIPNYDLSAKEIAGKVMEYGNIVDYVLLELPKSNQGGFKIDARIDLYKELKSMPAGWILGFVGGFTGWNVEERLNEIAKKVGDKNFCVDAVSGLRDRISDNAGDDLFDRKRVNNYLKAVAQVLK